MAESEKPQKSPDARPRQEVESYASPACLAHEMDPGYAGYLSNVELIELLNMLLEGERAGDRVAAALLAECPSPEAGLLLAAVRRDEARFAAMLARFVAKLGGTPSTRVGGFYDKVMALDGFVPRLTLLNRGQGWVVRKLGEVLPRIRDDALHSALKGMRGAHETNIARCEALILSLS